MIIPKNCEKTYNSLEINMSAPTASPFHRIFLSGFPFPWMRNAVQAIETILNPSPPLLQKNLYFVWQLGYLLGKNAPHVLVPGLLAGIHEGCRPLANSIHGGYGPGRGRNSLGVGCTILGRQLSHWRRHHWICIWPEDISSPAEKNSISKGLVFKCAEKWVIRAVVVCAVSLRSNSNLG